MTNITEVLSSSWDEPAVCVIEYPDGKTFSTAGYSWFECAWNAVLESRADNRRMRLNRALSDDQILTIEMTRHPFQKRKVRVADVMAWARRTGLYRELQS